MPTRVRSIYLTGLAASGELRDGTDYKLVEKGRRLVQVTPITLPATAAGLLGIRVGQDGDKLRLNSQGQSINLSGSDQIEGVWLTWMGPTSPMDTVEFALSFAEDGGT